MLRIIATPDTSNLDRGLYKLTVAIEETDLLLRNRHVQGSITWGDGTANVEIPRQAIIFGTTTAATTYSKTFTPGRYVVIVRANNFRSPTSDSDIFIAFIDTTEVTFATLSQDSDIISVGPIMSRDVGFPNADQWNFNIGRGIETVESSIRMLLSIAKGERLMNPEYGTNLNRIVFEQDDGSGSVDTQVQDEILLAVEQFAPFVSVQSISLNRQNSSNAVNIDVRFFARPNQHTFQVNLNFER
jgi:phage baseplate assembly protein W